MLPRVLEPEVMDTREEARDYDAMDHSEVNRLFVNDFLAAWKGSGRILDVGAGTAQIPIELCQRAPSAAVVAIDLAEEMLRLARENVERAGMTGRVTLEQVDAKQMPYDDGAFGAVISNSIVHHIPEPMRVLTEMVRVTGRGGVLFVRDLRRPDSEATLEELVTTYAGDANDHQQKMFADSLRAALTVEEMQSLVERLGFASSTVVSSSDRHWTWQAHRV